MRETIIKYLIAVGVTAFSGVLDKYVNKKKTK